MSKSPNETNIVIVERCHTHHFSIMHLHSDESREFRTKKAAAISCGLERDLQTGRSLTVHIR